LASLGCGNPTAVADLRPWERVPDLGCGGGIDVLLLRQARPSDREVRRPGHDRGDAIENRRQAGLTNVEFLKGFIEDVPLPAGRCLGWIRRVRGLPPERVR
jgi:arsenite methyltransferase